jgi:hypothetical protein
VNFTNASTSSFVGCLGKIGRNLAVADDLSWDSFRFFEDDAATSCVFEVDEGYSNVGFAHDNGCMLAALFLSASFATASAESFRMTSILLARATFSASSQSSLS